MDSGCDVGLLDLEHRHAEDGKQGVGSNFVGRDSLSFIVVPRGCVCSANQKGYYE
jgi:GTPase involved in cell partitioning and DNA repair